LTYNLRNTIERAKTPAAIQDNGRWDVITRELQNKQELIHRLMRENDDKSDALKLTGAEILDLRRQIKLVSSENVILKQKSQEQEDKDLANLIGREVEMMSNNELKNKIIKLSQMYHHSRIKIEELEKLLKTAQEDVSEGWKYKREMERLEEQHNKMNQQVRKMKEQVEGVKKYKDTIKKQELVISKLENILHITVQETKQAREASLELERLRTENMELKRRLGTNQGYPGNNQQAQKEINRLERIVNETYGGNGGNGDWEVEKMKLEIELNKAELRVETMQQQMDDHTRKYAKEISHLNGLLAEKQSIIDTMQMDINKFY
jgi:hypothetical protein